MTGEDRTQDTFPSYRRGNESRGYALFLVNDAGLRIVALPSSGAVVVGRASDAEVRVADERMSRRHLCIHIGAPLRIEDLRSANGTAIGGDWLAPGEQRTCAPGEAITAGATTMLIRGHTGPLVASMLDLPRPEVGASDRMKPVLALADRAAASMISVLLLGETGVGKDVLAERIHRASPRAAGRFLRLNCAAFSPTLLASELFGHERGAFTGATSAHPGLLQTAGGGTVFLDEVGDLPSELQAKLLLVLERREVLPVGAVRPRPLDVRFIAATNRDLPGDVETGAFRRDLYFRLNGITIEVPPLRERASEIEGLARLFAADAARSIGRPTLELTDDALAVLRGHSWPGNVRELRTVVERAVLMSSERAIRPCDIAFASRAPSSLAEVTPVAHPAGGSDDERRQIIDVLARCGGNQSRAAKLLGIARNTLIARIERYGIARPLSPRRIS